MMSVRRQATVALDTPRVSTAQVTTHVPVPAASQTSPLPASAEGRFAMVSDYCPAVPLYSASI